MAPEVHYLKGATKSYDKPADVFACGVIMYILLTGKKPFGNNMEITSGSANFNRPVFEKIPQDA